VKLGEILNAYTVNELKALITTCRQALQDSGPEGTRKEFLLGYLKERLTGSQTLTKLWQGLEPLEQKAIAAAYHDGGQLNRDAFTAQHGALPEALQPRGYGYGRNREVPLLNLFLYRDVLPDELMRGLVALVPEPEKFRLEGLMEPPKSVEVYGEARELCQANTEMAGLHDLSVYLRLALQGELSHSAVNRQLTAKSVWMLLDNLLEGDFIPHGDSPKLRDTIRPFGLDVFAQESGLLSRRTKSGLSELGKAFLYERNPEALLEAFESWTHQDGFDELSRIRALKGLGARGTRLTKPSTRREAVIEALSWCPAGVWLNIKDFYRAVKIWHFDFEVERSDYSHLYVGHKEYGWLGYADFPYWEITKGLYINAIIFEYLGSIGAVDVCYLPAKEAGLSFDYLDIADDYYSLYDGLFYFRINPLGAYLLGQATEYVPSKPLDAPLFTIDAELRLRVTAKLTPQLSQQLAQVAVPLSEGEYQLSTEKLLGALEAGAALAPIRDFLMQRHEGPLPQAARRWLEQAEENLSAFKKQDTALLVRARSQGLLELILNDPQLGKLASTTEARTLVIPSSKEKMFRERLKELGYLLVE
jgi:hypothetical protein